MKFKLYVIHDLITNSHTHPITIPSDRDAIDQFREMVNDDKSHLFKHPHDYVLKSIGVYNQETGELTPQPHEVVISGAAASGANNDTL